MKVTVFGSGHVGLVQSVVLAEIGHDVLCLDVDKDKIEKIKNGVVPFYEFGLNVLLKKHCQTGRLRFTLNHKIAVKHGVVQLIVVNTPLSKDGFIDLSHVFSVTEIIARYMDEYKLILEKSTVPVGTTERLRSVIDRQLKLRNVKITFDLVFNPEFLMEGSAVFSCMHPERIILGVNNCTKIGIDLLYELYKSFNFEKNIMMFMDTNSAELTKYAANCMLATKISFINEISNLAEIFGADIEKVRKGIALDSRIGEFFIYPGCGYGGSCFSKDIQTLIHHAIRFGYFPKLLNSVEKINNYQKNKLLIFIQRYFGKNLMDKTFALWGLSFKPNTDDISFSSSLVLMESLWQAGSKIQVYDPQAMGAVRNFYGAQESLFFADTKEDALRNADALIICTDWEDFFNPNFDLMKTMLKNPVIFDGRNLYDPEYLCKIGFIYYAIGRGMSCCTSVVNVKR